MNRLRTLISLGRRAHALILTSTLAAMPAIAEDLTVSIANIEGTAGTLMVAVLSSEAAFAGEAPAAMSLLLPARPGTVTFSTDALSAGSYGIRVMHDENGNGEMDSNMVGMPTEAWGFSNNAMGSFGPPTWSDVRFDLNDTTAINIELNH